MISAECKEEYSESCEQTCKQTTNMKSDCSLDDAGNPCKDRKVDISVLSVVDSTNENISTLVSSSFKVEGEHELGVTIAQDNLIEDSGNICDPLESHDDEFDVELCSNETTKSNSHITLQHRCEGNKITDFDRAADCDSACKEEKSNQKQRQSVYGKVVKSIQKSFRKLVQSKNSNSSTCSLSSTSVHESFVNPLASVSQSSQNNQDKQPSIHYDHNENYHKTIMIDVSYDKPLLPPIDKKDVGKVCLALDLDETLVHSSFEDPFNADLVVPVHLGQGVYQPIYVCKRPGVDDFLEFCCEHFEVIIFTASLSNYADPVIDFLDPNRKIKNRLYRESCLQFQGLYIKDLSRLGREMEKVLIIDNSPTCYSLQPRNALRCKSWFCDLNDGEFEERIIPLLSALKDSPSVSHWRDINLLMIECPYP